MKKEAREGYKMTELGEIPNEWKIKKLSDVSEIIMGQSPNSNSYNNDGIGIAFFQGKTEFGRINPIVKKWCSNPTKISKPLDILISVRAPVGAVNINNIEACIGRGLGAIRQNEFSNYRYLYYAIQQFQDFLLKSAQGSTFEAINSNDLKSLKIPIPSLGEQEKIAEILSTVDEQIDNTEKLIQKNQELKKGLMQQLLTKGIGHTEFKKTELGEIPKDWEIKLLEDLSIKIGDGLHGTPVYNKKGKYYFINGNNLNEGKIVLTDETKMIDKLEYEKYKKELNENTILLSLNGTIGNLSFYNYENIVLGKSVGYINLNDDIDKIYIFYALSSEDIKKYFYKELTGTTIKNLSLNTLRRTKIKVPTILEQEKIALIVSSIDEKIEKIKEKKENLNEIKKGLMQQLLNGKIRVE
ncbi:restriction endonuclease subunit S [Clostridium perfringens]|uniref:restriction endonuclease subunit S n=1 Tax=Clostridium perfringens TaxID=1502 RepID=UPI0028E0F190|nr:restriction endonuclease subunit S [Clostridium perfringens]MDT9332898.1 restriction endonuclease subunit S [Clostridium perfringens]